MKRAYPIDVMPGFWKKLEEGIEAERIFSTEAVLHEITGVDDQLAKWAKAQSGLFLPMNDEAAAHLPDILTKCPNLIDPTKKKDEADPYVLAQALASGATVVTQENSLGKKNARINIPDACLIMNAPSVNLLTMIRKMGWSF